jgi:hypothetical protein
MFMPGKHGILYLRYIINLKKKKKNALNIYNYKL